MTSNEFISYHIDQHSGDIVFTTNDYIQYGKVPSLSYLLSIGKRILFMSGMDYGKSMKPYIFPKYSTQICNWR
jgi:hypothetical protein